MNAFVELEAIAQISVTLAAFTSLLAAVRGGNLHEWAPRPRLGFWLLLTYSLSALGFSLLPSILRDLGLRSWGGAIALLALFHVIGAALFIGRHVLLTRSGFASPSRALWYVVSSVMCLTAAVLIWSLFGGMGGPSYNVYHLGVMVCLLVAVNAFVGFLRLDRPAA